MLVYTWSITSPTVVKTLQLLSCSEDSHVHGCHVRDPAGTVSRPDQKKFSLQIFYVPPAALHFLKQLCALVPHRQCLPA